MRSLQCNSNNNETHTQPHNTRRAQKTSDGDLLLDYVIRTVRTAGSRSVRGGCARTRSSGLRRGGACRCGDVDVDGGVAVHGSSSEDAVDEALHELRLLTLLTSLRLRLCSAWLRCGGGACCTGSSVARLSSTPSLHKDI